MPIYPHLIFEKRIFNHNVTIVAGVDEAGRGAWAGPIVAGAFVLQKKDLPIPKIIKKNIKDSKLLNSKKRGQAYLYLTQNYIWSTGFASHEEIDKIGIQAANQLVMTRAVEKLILKPDYLLIDGRGFKFNIEFQNVIKGDLKIFCIAAASIIAKVTRDKILIDYDKKFPNYYFCQNKGYGTKNHFKSLRRYGCCPVHRKSFKPMSNMI